MERYCGTENGVTAHQGGIQAKWGGTQTPFAVPPHRSIVTSFPRTLAERRSTSRTVGF